ncbi:flagellin [Geobacillus thermodenitrificans]|uniref:Flagellin n=1 Tax=Geobacillus thermodenitrificans (strain NG80-2) TaxID=420246 RepID=A4ISU7_GEOTN|nr:flagellin [Geobacillus thermodenitrificans]ABO68401.1 Flagellin protein FliB(S) [Geobacillus thermodenitrificans NG80-2]
MRINHNIAALNTYRQLTIGQGAAAKNMEKLSSGLRINRAGDDAAGLAISEKMRGQIRGLEQASRNAQDAISLIQTAEGALNETHSMLQRMRELVVQANNGTNNSDDLQAIQDEINQLKTEITDLANRTEFNTKKLLNGSFGVKLDSSSTATGLTNIPGAVDVSSAAKNTTYTITVDESDNTITIDDGNNNSQTIAVADVKDVKGVLNFSSLGIKINLANSTDFTASNINGQTIVTNNNSQELIQIGANKDQTLALSFNDMRATALGTATVKVNDIDVTSGTQTFNERLDAIDEAIKQVSAERSKMGAAQNRLEHTINNLGTSAENLTAAESRIRDVDYALAA